MTDELCTCGDPNCPCGKCHGADWVFVGTEYIRRQVPDPPIDLLTKVADEAAAYLHEQVRLARCAVANSAYPCRACNGTMFFRWREGHLEEDHDRAGCPECVNDAPRRRKVKA